MEAGVEILFEDNHLLVAYKPRGILSQADGSDFLDMLTILKRYLKEKYNKAGAVYLGLVHRLDINTAGVMVFARTSKAASRLNQDILNSRFEKRYVAIIEGHLTEGGTLRHFLLKNEKERKAYVNPLGKEAVLEYQILKTSEIAGVPVTYVDILLRTGRFHQIRAQFQAIGHPLYGDKKYGSTNDISHQQFPLEAYFLSFYHPVTKELVAFKKMTLLD